jgi:hypothetical protein
LRGLRDSFKDTLSFIMGMRQDVIYLSGLESVRPLRGLLDTYICRVGPLSEADGRDMITHQLRDLTLSEKDSAKLLALTGAYPSLLRVGCQWYRQTAERPPHAGWLDALLAQPNTQHRLREWWQGLSQEEQAVLAAVHILQIQSAPGKQVYRGLVWQHGAVLATLAAKGVCQQKGEAWLIVGELMLAFAGQQAGRSRGRLWWDEQTDQIYQGQLLVEDLSPQEQTILQFMLRFPGKRHTHDDLIEATWPPDEQKGGISTEALYQAIRSTRKKIEPNPSEPRYLVTWRGQREGGYQLFPEGRPG